MSYSTNTQTDQPQADKLGSVLITQGVENFNESVDFSTLSQNQSNVYSINYIPTQPKTLLETGLDQQLIVELVAKTMLMLGKVHLTTLVSRLKLSIHVLNEVLSFMVVEHMAMIVRRGATDIDVEYQLTLTGKASAQEFMSRSSYIGSAPVTLNAYQAMVARQSVRNNRVTQADIDAAFSGITLNPDVKNQIGAAMNSGRPLFLYGPAGSGKTYLSEKLSRLLPGLIAVPHAVVVDNEIIQVYDPLLHIRVDTTQAQSDATDYSQDYRQTDSRWIVCKRPVVITGGELTLDMLDLKYDRVSGFYQAPPHFKANNGIFIVDDLGRQKVAPLDLMNRWVVPMEHAHDYLSLHTGYKFTVPFDMSLVFSTNLSPSAIADESFLRRLGYKIYIGPLTEDEYRRVFCQHAQALGIVYDEVAFRYLVDQLHQNSGQALIACYPRDLLNQVVDYARYYGETPMMTEQAFNRAWRTYFAIDHVI